MDVFRCLLGHFFKHLLALHYFNHPFIFKTHWIHFVVIGLQVPIKLLLAKDEVHPEQVTSLQDHFYVAIWKSHLGLFLKIQWELQSPSLEKHILFVSVPVFTITVVNNTIYNYWSISFYMFSIHNLFIFYFNRSPFKFLSK